MRNIYFLFLIILVSFSSCINSHIEEKIRFEDNNWTKFNELEFKIPVEAGKSYDFSGNIITDSTYSNRKMELGFYIYLPSGEERLADLTIRILDFEYNTLGKKTKEGIILPVNFKENIQSEESGEMDLKIVLHSQYYDNTGIVGLDLLIKEK